MKAQIMLIKQELRRHIEVNGRIESRRLWTQDTHREAKKAC